MGGGSGVSAVGKLFDDPAIARSTTQLKPGDVLIAAGAVPAGLHRVHTGAFDVTVSAQGREITTGALGPGAIVGEISLFAGGRATATVTAREPSAVETIAVPDARDWLSSHPDVASAIAAEGRERVDRNELAILLSELTGSTDTHVIDESLDLCSIVRLAGGETLFRQGDHSDAAYVVITGRLSVRQELEDGCQEVGRLGRGQIVGETGLFEEAPRSASVVAVRDSVVARISGAAFEQLMGHHPSLMIRMGRQMLERMVRPRRDLRATSVLAVAVATQLDRSESVEAEIVAALRPYGKVALVSPSQVDADLGRPGTAIADVSDLGVPRLTEYLHEIEIRHDMVVLCVAADDPDPWVRRATALADRVLVVVSPDPDERERTTIRRLVGSVPDTTTTIAVVHHPPRTARPFGSRVLLEEIGADEMFHIRSGVPDDVARVARIATSRSVALVLGGGGARGFAHLGVYRAMVELGIPIDVIVGSSIGAPLGAGIARGDTPEEAVTHNTTGFAKLLDYTIPVVSLIKAERVTRSIETRFGDWDFEDTWIPFRCVSTNLTQSRVEVHRRGPLAPAVRASVAIPGIMPPVPWGLDLLVDGGVLNNLPVDVVAEEGRSSTIIAVDVAPAMGPSAEADFGPSVSGWQALRAGLGQKENAYPKISSTLLRSMLVGSIHHRDRLIAEAPVDLLLDLDMSGTGLLDFDQVGAVADRGYALAKPLIEAWLDERGGWR
jgi:predicted acylesterase/phospholipase RssA/CRP-like cAMP-binding protein